MPRRFDPQQLPDWLARACDAGTSTVPGRRTLLDWPTLLPRLTVYLHLAEETIQAEHGGPAGGVARWEGEGPVTLRYVREQLAPYHAVKVTPVVDLAGQEPVDAHEIPERHRRAVRLRTPADCFPFAANLEAGLDIDHTQAYQRAQQGQSRMDNYGPMGRFHHRVKTHGGWQVAQPFDGIYVWRDPHGEFYLVDHTGTRKITQPRSGSTPQSTRSRVETHWRDLLLDVSGFPAA